MSEKQFKLLSGGFDEKGNPLYLIKDTTDMIGDYEICNKVIEQQATISALKEENERLRNENKRLKSQQKWTEETLQKKLIVEIKPDLYGWRANVKELENE